MQRLMLLQLIVVLPWFGHGAPAPHAGVHTENPAPLNVWHSMPFMQLFALGLHES